MNVSFNDKLFNILINQISHLFGVKANDSIVLQVGSNPPAHNLVLLQRVSETHNNWLFMARGNIAR